jgi:hypothetical protein
MSKTKEGWMAEKPTHTRVYHYIVDTRSLCKRYGFYLADLEPHPIGASKGWNDCAECWKRVVRRFAEKDDQETPTQ